MVIEWVKRYNHDKGDYRSINLQNTTVKPIFEVINELESTYFKQSL